MSLNPNFKDLKDPAVITEHIEQLKGKAVSPATHLQVIAGLLEYIEPVYFQQEAFPDYTAAKERYAELIEPLQAKRHHAVLKNRMATFDELLDAYKLQAKKQAEKARGAAVKEPQTLDVKTKNLQDAAKKLHLAIDDFTVKLSDLQQGRQKLQAEIEEASRAIPGEYKDVTLKELIEQQKELGKKLKGEFTLQQKHYLIITIEQILDLAEKHRWGLCKNHDFIYLYNGAFWCETDKEAFQSFLGEAAEKMGVEKFDARFHAFRKQLMQQFLNTAYLPTPEPEPEKVLINLLNGTFEISPQGQRLRPCDRSDFITYQLPFEYDPQAKAPLFESYLNKVLPDKERQMVLAEYLGYVFIKHGSKSLKEEKALILYGEGANGKSVFYEVINALLGAENVSSYSLQSLTNENGYFRAKIANTLVNYASEINGNLEASIFKQLVSGEPVEARLPYGQPFVLRQYAKLIFNCNGLPKDVEHTNAYFRRFLIIPFDVTIPEHEQDKNLHTKIIENELSGVFNWVLDGLNRLLEQKRFSHCEAAKQALEQYKTESNSVKMFLDENGYERSATEQKLIKELHVEYKAFCQEDGMTAFKKVNFIKQLRALKVVVEPGANNKRFAYLKGGGNEW